MTAALALLLGASLVAVALPAPMRRLGTGRIDPIVLVVCWFLSMAGVLGAAPAAVLLLLPGHGGAAALPRLVGNYWTTMRHGELPRLDVLLGLVGTVFLLAVLARLVVLTTRGARRRREQAREH